MRDANLMRAANLMRDAHHQLDAQLAPRSSLLSLHNQIVKDRLRAAANWPKGQTADRRRALCHWRAKRLFCTL